jgi:hypothetical protein
MEFEQRICRDCGEVLVITNADIDFFARKNLPTKTLSAMQKGSQGMAR